MLPVLARIPERGKRIGGLARLRNEDRERTRVERHFAVTELGCNIDFDRQVSKAFEPIPRHHAGIICGAAGGDGNALERAEVERQRHRQRDAPGDHIEIVRERVTDDFRLFVNFLRHEMAMVAFVDQHYRSLRLEHVAVNGFAIGVVNLGAVAVNDRAIAVLQIADRIGEGGERDRIGTDIHGVVAKTDRQRRAFAGADQQIILAGKEKGERERAAQPRQRRFHRLDRRTALFDLVADQMRDHLAVGLGRELGTLAFQLASQLAEILDDAVMHDGNHVGRVRMRVGFVRPAVRRPAGVADADRSRERFPRESLFQILELALGAAARQHAMLERGNASRIVAAILEAFERIDEKRRDRFAADDADNAAHPSGWSPQPPSQPNPLIGQSLERNHNGRQIKKRCGP